LSHRSFSGDSVPFSTRLRQQGPKLVRDRLLELMRDMQWHAAYELEQLLPQGEWVGAMRELLQLHLAFDRVSHSLRIRQMNSGERKQSLVDLLAGIDASQPDPLAALPEGEKTFAFHEERIEHLEEKNRKDEGIFDPSKDAVDEPVGEKLVLSEVPGELELPMVDSVTMSSAILAMKGSGKTYLGGVIAEEFLLHSELKVPVVIVDPTGVWHGLLATNEGKPSSFPLTILGGSHGEIAVTHRQGSQVAEAVHETWPRSFILDLSHMEPEGQHGFVADFGQRIFVLNERAPFHLIVDEADEFAPQVIDSSSRHQKRSLGVIDRMVRRGRTRGFGTTVITQRTAVISKNVLSQSEALFILRMVAPSDIAAVNEWMRHRVSIEHRMACLEQLPNLPPGTSYFMQSGISAPFRRFVVRKKKSFDSSRTPRANEAFVEPELAKSPENILVVVKKWLGTVVETSSSEEV